MTQSTGRLLFATIQHYNSYPRFAIHSRTSEKVVKTNVALLFVYDAATCRSGLVDTKGGGGGE